MADPTVDEHLEMAYEDRFMFDLFQGGEYDQEDEWFECDRIEDC
jgi:hypothetical protein